MGIAEYYDLNLEKSEIFIKFQNQIKNDFGSKEAEDSVIYRFLTARDFDFKQAYQMLQAHIEWKKKFKVDTILEDFKTPEVMEKYAHFDIIGFDMEGCPIIFLSFGNLDIRGLFKSIRKAEALRYLAYFLTCCEKLILEQSAKLGRPVEKWNVVADFENLSIANALYKPAIDALIEALIMYDGNFPERLKLGFAFNANAIFTIIFNIGKSILSAKTVNKIKVFSKNGYKEEFLKLADPSELPAFLGGTKTDPDGNPFCLESINFGGQIPKSYYFKKNAGMLNGQPGVKSYCLNPKSKANISFNVSEPNFTIEWEIEAKSNDIAFGLFFVETDDASMRQTSIIDLQRVEAHLLVETGTYKTEKAGNYIFMLDNSYSWLRQKQIFCRVSVIAPDGQKTIITD